MTIRTYTEGQERSQAQRRANDNLSVEVALSSCLIVPFSWLVAGIVGSCGRRDSDAGRHGGCREGHFSVFEVVFQEFQR